MQKIPSKSLQMSFFDGISNCGAKRSRTADLCSAIAALYQLSYSPRLRPRILPTASRCSGFAQAAR